MALIVQYLRKYMQSMKSDIWVFKLLQVETWEGLPRNFLKNKS